MRLLLLSNSTAPGKRYLEHAMDMLAETLAGVRRLVFVPFALAGHDAYTAQVARVLEPLGVDVAGAHESDPIELLDSAQAVFVGGGNTFRLLRELYARELLAPIRSRAARGTVYIGSSAGTNVACPTIRTTNDMPIAHPPSFEAAGLVPFQINPHYLDPLPSGRYMGETREERIAQFLECNDAPVLGLREGTWLVIRESSVTLGGVTAGARLFRRGTEPEEFGPGADLSGLLDTLPRFDLP
ncbi:MAG TPA: dipeptidase PepE [Amycolatopsis sp.]|uniref:dipeptidase PepE n=1 Tax=Amycolatopsis sp. TaxID=37632 RepID=UPI002B492AE3|nr:dipeptidase PepE [Amycolatopsis sp.]HKS44337.1 dipeptidase PepE [Amycolatopsis sp.]